MPDDSLHQTALEPLIGAAAGAGTHPIVRRLLSSGLTERDVVLVDAAHAGSAGPLGRIGRAWRERFQAMTDIGLSPPRTIAEPPRAHLFPGQGQTPDLGYLAAGDPAGRTVLFIHGTPGAAVDWTPFLSNVPEGEYRIAVDRPGFGRSDPHAPVVRLRDQARAIAQLLAARPGPAVVVGSSYGGPVALQLAAGHPDQVAGVLVVGSAGDPAHEAPHPLQHLAATGPLGRLLPRALRHSNAELLALRGELEALGRRLRAIRAPVTILQGLNDTLVPAENAPYLAHRLDAALRRRVVLVGRAGHFLHILRSELVERALSELIDGTGETAFSPLRTDA